MLIGGIIMISFWRLVFSLFLGVTAFSLSYADEFAVPNEEIVVAAEEETDKAVSDATTEIFENNENKLNALMFSLKSDLSIDDLRGMAQAMVLSAARCGDNSYCVSPVSRDDFFVVTRLLDARLAESIPNQSEQYVQLATLRGTLGEYQALLYGEEERRLADGLPPEGSLDELAESLDLPDEPPVIRTAGGSEENEEDGGGALSEELIEMLSDDPM